jgi:CRISPR-associated protein Csm2
MNNIANMSAEQIVQEAENVARTLAMKDRLKTGQIRNFYSGITRLRSKYATKGNWESVQSELVMLKPKLAFAAGRQLAVKTTFYPRMTEAVESVLNADDKEKALKNFFMYVESIVAYHKFFGGE